MDTVDTAIKALKDNEGRDYVVIAFEETRVGIYSSLPNNDAVPMFLREVANAMELEENDVPANKETPAEETAPVKEEAEAKPKKARKPRKSNK